jgi:nucleotide-binding universal stress UspA family protein
MRDKPSEGDQGMFKTVVWATDGSEAADQALPHAKSFASDPGASLVVVHVEEKTLPGKGGGSRSKYASESDLKEKVRSQVSELSAGGIQAKLELATTQVGGAAHVIAEVAEREHADVIVIGTRGHTALAGLLLGSVPQRLLHLASIPVLAVPTAKDES